MKSSDEKLLKMSGLNTIDAIVSVNPILSVARWLAKALLSNWLAMRQDRALEFVEMIINNPWKYTEDLMKTEEFQDGFVYFIEQYIRERNKDKRLISQKIFLWFATSEEKEQFELERYLSVLSLLWPDNIESLYKIKNKLIDYIKLRWKKQINEFCIDSSRAWQNVEENQYLTDLASLWIVNIQYSEDRRDEKIHWVWVEYKITDFWYNFLEFLTK